MSQIYKKLFYRVIIPCLLILLIGTTQSETVLDINNILSLHLPTLIFISIILLFIIYLIVRTVCQSMGNRIEYQNIGKILLKIAIVIVIMYGFYSFCSWVNIKLFGGFETSNIHDITNDTLMHKDNIVDTLN